jgi:hypothetical protein
VKFLVKGPKLNGKREEHEAPPSLKGGQDQ